jgi:hypothetical protein
MPVKNSGTPPNSKTMLKTTVAISASKAPAAASAPAYLVVQKSQEVRVGTLYDEASGDVRTNGGVETVIRVRDLVAGNPPNYFSVAGSNDGDTIPGRIEYLPDTLEVHAHAGWAYAAGNRPRPRTKRVRTLGHNQAAVLVHVVSESPPSDPDDGVHRAYFLEPQDGQTVDIELLDSAGAAIAKITVECTSTPGTDTKDYAYVTAGRECYVEVDANTNDLDATDAKILIKEPAGTEPGDNWTGSEQAFLSDVRARVAASII